MTETTKEIDEILEDLEVSWANRFGIKHFIKKDINLQNMLLEYLNLNKELIREHTETPLDRASVIIKHMTRIIKYLGMRIAFDYYPPEPWEQIPESQREVIR